MGRRGRLRVVVIINEYGLYTSFDFVELHEDVAAVLRLADLLGVLAEFGAQVGPSLRRDLLHEALDDVVAELVAGEADEAAWGGGYRSESERALESFSR